MYEQEDAYDLIRAQIAINSLISKIHLLNPIDTDLMQCALDAFTHIGSIESRHHGRRHAS